MDEDDWIAGIDLESLERNITQQQKPGQTAACPTGVNGGAQIAHWDIEVTREQPRATCRNQMPQQASGCQTGGHRSLHAFTASDLLKTTLPHHNSQQSAAPHAQHWPLQPRQQQPVLCTQDQGMHTWQLATNGMTRTATQAQQQQLQDQVQQQQQQPQQQYVMVKAPMQEHWPGRPQWRQPSSNILFTQSQLQQQQVLGRPPPVSQQSGPHPSGCQPHSWPQQQREQSDQLSHGQQHQHFQHQHFGGWQQQQVPVLHVTPQQGLQEHCMPQPPQQHLQHQEAYLQHQQSSLNHHHHHQQQPADLVPRCPYKVCPGVFSFCGADLSYRRRKDSTSGSSGFWGCSTWPKCDFKYFPAQQVPRPELGCEVVDHQHFRVVPQPAAEVAVARAGGIRTVLAAAGVTLDHLEVKQPAELPQQAAAATGTQPQQLSAEAIMAVAASGATGCLSVTAGFRNLDQLAGDMKASAAAEPGLAAAPDFSWSPEDSLLLRLVDYELVAAVLNRAKPDLLGKGGSIPHNTLEAFRSPDAAAAGTAEVESRYACMPASLQAALLPFQQTGVRFGLERQGRVLIADEMGVGKTVQALALASCYQDEWPLLIVVPASLRLVWAEEIERWLPHVRPGDVTVIEGKEDRLCDLPDANARRREKLPAITITSYEMLKRLSCAACQKLPQGQPGEGGSGGRGGSGSESGRGRGRGSTGARAKAKLCCTGPDHCMAALPWGVVIIDESHNLRTTNSRQADSPHTEAAVAAGSRAGRLILLSGTPSLSRPYDLYRQIDVLVPGLLGKAKEDFALRYCDRRLVPVITSRGESRLKWSNAGGARLVELHGLLVRRVMIRRLKRDVMAQLPPKRRQVVRLPCPPAHRWPKEQEPGADRQAAAAASQLRHQEDQAAAGPSGGGAADEPLGAAAGVMSAAHRVALAKLPDAIDWLMAALGEAGSSSAGAGGGSGTGAQHNVPAGPLRPAWRKDLGGSSGGQATSAAAGSSSADDDACEDEGGGSSGGSSSSPKFLVFAHHRDVMDKLAAALSGYGSSSSNIDPDDVEAAAPAAAAHAGSSGCVGHGVGYVRVDGSHDSTERLAAVRRFRSDPSIRVALLSITAAAVGLDFSSASMVVFVELPLEVSLVRQAEDRAHRKGQSKAVNVYFLCAQGTVDDKRWQALNVSLSHVSQVHDGQAETLPEPLARAAAADDGDEDGGGRHGGDSLEETRPEQGAAAEGCNRQQQQVETGGIRPTASQASQQAAKPDTTEPANAVKHQLAMPQGDLTAAAAGAADAGGPDAVAGHLPGSALVVDLTANSPVKSPSSGRYVSGSSFKRMREPLGLTPSKAAAAATTSPAAAAAALAAIAAADHMPSSHNKRLRLTALPQLPADGSPAAADQSTCAGHLDAAAAAAAAGLPDVWFEVSGHTSRLHYHLSSDGSQPLGLNLPLDWLVMPEEQGALQAMAAAWDKAWQQQGIEEGDQRQENMQKQVLQGEQQGVQPGSSGEQQQPPPNSCTEPVVAKPVEQVVSPDQLQQQQTLAPVLHQRLPCMASTAQQHQQMHSTPPTGGNGSAAGDCLLSSRSSGRGAARPAISSLSLLPFATPPTKGAAASQATGVPGLQRQQQQQQHPAPGQAQSARQCHSPAGSVVGRLHELGQQQQQQSCCCGISPGQLISSSPALTQKLQRLLGSGAEQQPDSNAHQQTQQQQKQQKQHLNPEQATQQQDTPEGACEFGVIEGVAAAADDIVAARSSKSFVGLDMVAAATVDDQQQQAAGGLEAGSELQIELPDSENGQEQQQGEVVIADSQPQSDQQEHHEAHEHHQDKQQLVVPHAAIPQQQSGLLPAAGSAVAAAAGTSLLDCRSAPGFFGQSGLTCLTLKLTGAQLLELLQLGRAFAADWSELRSVTRNRLVGRVVPPDLAAAVDAVTAAAAGSGAFGVGVVRYLKDIQEGDPNLPPGAKLEQVTVHYPAGRQQLATYRQAFTGPRTRHCLHCFGVVVGATLPADAVLQGGLDLFCSLDCERLYYIKNSSSGIRRALFKLEQGVCTQCGLDCHTLVRQLQQIGKDEPAWLSHRRSIIAKMAPKFMERGCATYLDRLINQATAGNAWHADHIVAVYEGGGGCDMDNLRTLCVPCHAAVTKQQARARADERLRRKLGTHDIRHWFGGSRQQPAGVTAPTRPVAAMKRKRHAAADSLYLDDLASPQQQQQQHTSSKTAKRAAAADGDQVSSKTALAVGCQGSSRQLASASGCDESGAYPLKQQQQQGQEAVEVISILSSPSSCCRHTAAAAVAGEGHQLADRVLGTPTSGHNSSQGRRLAAAAATSPALLSPAAALRAAAAAAKVAAAAAASGPAGVGRQALRSMLDQFRCGSQGDEERQGEKGEQQQQQQQDRPKRKRGRPRKCPNTMVADGGVAASGQISSPVGWRYGDGDNVDHHCELTAADRRQVTPAAVQTGTGSLHTEELDTAAAGGKGRMARCGVNNSSSRKAAHAAAMRNQLARGDESSSGNEEHQASSQRRQPKGEAASAATLPGRPRMMGQSKGQQQRQQQQPKRAKGGKRARTVLDT